jgi:hypothetical protein
VTAVFVFQFLFFLGGDDLRSHLVLVPDVVQLHFGPKNLGFIAVRRKSADISLLIWGFCREDGHVS